MLSKCLSEWMNEWVNEWAWLLWLLLGPPLLETTELEQNLVGRMENRLEWEAFLAHRIIRFLLFLGRTLGLGFHTVVCRKDRGTASLGFFIYQTKQTQTLDLMDGIPEWLISLSPLNNGIKPLASSRLALGGGWAGVVGWNGEISVKGWQRQRIL